MPLGTKGGRRGGTVGRSGMRGNGFYVLSCGLRSSTTISRTLAMPAGAAVGKNTVIISTSSGTMPCWRQQLATLDGGGGGGAVCSLCRTWSLQVLKLLRCSVAPSARCERVRVPAVSRQRLYRCFVLHELGCAHDALVRQLFHKILLIDLTPPVEPGPPNYF